MELKIGLDLVCKRLFSHFSVCLLLKFDRYMKLAKICQTQIQLECKRCNKTVIHAKLPSYI